MAVSPCSARNCTRNRTHLQSQWLRFARAFRRSATPLVWAAAFGRAAVAELLLAKGADANAELTGGCVGYTFDWLRRILGKRASGISAADWGPRHCWNHTISLKQDTFDPITLTPLFQSKRSSIFIAPRSVQHPSFRLCVYTLSMHVSLPAFMYTCIVRRSHEKHTARCAYDRRAIFIIWVRYLREWHLQGVGAPCGCLARECSRFCAFDQERSACGRIGPVWLFAPRIGEGRTCIIHPCTL